MCGYVYDCVFAYSSESSVSGPRQQLRLRGEQLLVERRKQRVSSERVTLTEPSQLLHVHAAQCTQHCHLLVQLQGGHRHVKLFYHSGGRHRIVCLFFIQKTKEKASAQD